MIPKFRAWNEKTKSFINYGDLVLDLESGKVYAGDIGLMDSVIDVTDQIDLMQSTGLKDKNGVEIFEGDICKIQRIPSGMKPIFVVSDYIKEKLIFSKITIFDQNSYEEQGGYTGNFLEVIGNRFENPELLEAK